MKSRILIFVLLATFACKNDDEPVADDPEIFATRFFEEAAKRGITVPSQASIPITFVAGATIAPSAGSSTLDPPTVKISKEYWDSATPSHRELLIFHELGHAALRRIHCDERLPNCEYKSIMFHGTDWVYNEEGEKRDWYFDELFDPSTPYPAWGGTVPTIHTELPLGMIEEKAEWEYHVESGATQTGTKDEDILVSGEHSLAMHGATAGSGVAYWYLPKLLNTNDIPVGSTLTVSVKVKTNSLTGNGVWIWVLADPNVESGYSVTSDVYRIVKGTNDWIEISQKLHCYPGTHPNIMLFLGIDGTGTGDVWFDEIKVGYDH